MPVFVSATKIKRRTKKHSFKANTKLEYCVILNERDRACKGVETGWKRTRERRVETARVGAAEMVKCVPHVRKRVRGFSSHGADEWLERGMEKEE